MRRAMVFLVMLQTGGVFAGADPVRDGESAELQAGRKIYLAKCAKCHKLYNPGKYSDRDWSRWMKKMTVKAKLDPEQERELTAYVATLRKGK